MENVFTDRVMPSGQTRAKPQKRYGIVIGIVHSKEGSVVNVLLSRTEGRCTLSVEKTFLDLHGFEHSIANGENSVIFTIVMDSLS